jgi:hypothetical protein
MTLSYPIGPAIPVAGPTVNLPSRYSAEQVTTGLCIPQHDYIENSYTGSDLTGVVYKRGGKFNTSTDVYTGGVVVAELKLVYSGGVLTKVARIL